MELSELERRTLQICGISNLKGRGQNVVFAKSLIYHDLFVRGYSISEIGRLLKAHHSSVIHLLKRYNEWLEYDKEFKMLVEKFNSYENRNQ